MAKPLFERIQSALSPDARAVDVAALVEEVRRELAAAEQERDANHAAAISVDSDDATADAAADAEAKASRRIVRLTGQIEQLEARKVEMEEAERTRAAAALRAEIVAERDQLVDDLRDQWPKIEAQILALFWRIKHNDMRNSPYPDVFSAEAIARNSSPLFYNASRFVDMNLPVFDVSADAMRQLAWPPRGEVEAKAFISEPFTREQAAAAQARWAALSPATKPATRVMIDGDRITEIAAAKANARQKLSA